MFIPCNIWFLLSSQQTFLILENAVHMLWTTFHFFFNMENDYMISLQFPVSRNFIISYKKHCDKMNISC